MKDGDRIEYLLYDVSAFVLVFFLAFRLLSVLRGRSVFSSPPQRPMTSDFVGFSIPDCIHYVYFPILSQVRCKKLMICASGSCMNLIILLVYFVLLLSYN